jgi:hypothetical protein
MTIEQLEEEMVRLYKDEVGAGRDQLSAVRRILRILREDVGIKTNREFGDELFNRFEAARQDHSPSTRANNAARLKTICRRAADWGLIPSMPSFPEIPSPRHFAPTVRTGRVSRDDVDKLLETLQAGADTWEGMRLQALVAVIVVGGLRLSQALGLRIADVDLANTKIRVPRPSGRMSKPNVVSIRVSSELGSILGGWIPQTRCEWLFPGVECTGPWKRTYSVEWMGSPIAQLRIAAFNAGIDPLLGFDELQRFVAENAVKGVAFNRQVAKPASITPDRPSVPIVEIMAEREPVAIPDNPPAALPKLRLGRPGEPASIDDQEMRLLTDSQRAVLAALLESGPEGLDTEEIESKSGQGGWRQTLLRLKKSHPLWDSIILFPGRPWGRYRLAAIGALG